MYNDTRKMHKFLNGSLSLKLPQSFWVQSQPGPLEGVSWGSDGERSELCVGDLE